jgi:LysR family transcriptional regulator, glycine cleavage system transcriptional activator
LAAQDLCITQSAVSRQIRSLERMLGTRLFTRGHRSITFTPAAERLFRSADSAVQQLQDAVGVIGVSSTRHARSPQSTTAVTSPSSLRLAARTSIRLGHSSGTRVIFATRITIPQNSRS